MVGYEAVIGAPARTAGLLRTSSCRAHTTTSGLEYVAPAPAVITTPAPVAEYIAPASAVIATHAPVVEYIGPALAVIAAPSPVVKDTAPQLQRLQHLLWRGTTPYQLPRCTPHQRGSWGTLDRSHCDYSTGSTTAPTAVAALALAMRSAAPLLRRAYAPPAPVWCLGVGTRLSTSYQLLP